MSYRIIPVFFTAACFPFNGFYDGELVAADYWSEEPEILSAGFGFDGIIGIEQSSDEVTKAAVRAAGGAWHSSLRCTSGEEPELAVRTSAASVEGTEIAFLGTVDDDDGLPIVFSWPVATETVNMADFRFTLNTGETVTPRAVGMWPNWELNERNVVVAFGRFGNRLSADDPDAEYVVRAEIVEDDVENTPLTLVGPDGVERSAVGLTWETDRTPYDSGPALVGAKLNWVDDEPLGEGSPNDGVIGVTPNDEISLYGSADFRLRVLTTGGFSPDGVRGVRPDQYSSFFRLHAAGEDGETVLIEAPQTDYAVAGGTLRVLGLSELGLPFDPDQGVYYDDCYVEDRDNYIDIILQGDEAAARSLQFVEIPAGLDGYLPFYNPGGPGPEPFDGVVYTAPGPRDLEPVLIALDDPMRVDREAP